MDKLRRKSLDMIVANDVSDERIGFNSDDNAVTVLGFDMEEALPKGSKRTVARQLIGLICEQFAATSQSHQD